MNSDTDSAISNAPACTQDEIRRPAQISQLPALFRGVGAAVLLTSVSLFLFRGWEGGNDLTRYCLLLLETAGLAALSLATGHFLKEGKGARLLYVLALACVPANFAILGGFLYAQFGLDASTGVYPAMFTWATEGALSAALVTVLGTGVLAPTAALGYRVLARHAWRTLTGLFLTANVALLLPVRNPALVGLGALALCVFALIRVTTLIRSDRTLLSTEGVVARLLMFVPIAVLVARNLWLHAADSLLVMSLALMAFALLRYVTREIMIRPAFRQALEVASIAPAIAATAGAMGVLEPGIALTSAWTLPIGGTVLFALLSELGLRATTARPQYRSLAACGLGGLLLANALIMHGVLAAALCIAGGLGLVAHGVLSAQRTTFLAGVACAAVGLADQIVRIVQVFDLGSWGSLGALGVGAIILGSLLERQGDALRAHLTRLRHRYAAWQK